MLTEKQILLLQSISKVGKKTIFKISEDISEFYDSDRFLKFLLNWAEKNKQTNLINIETVNVGMTKVDEIFEASEKSKIKLLGFWNANFPQRLKEIKNPPVLIHVAGNVQNLNQKKSIAVIGTREPSAFGFKSGKRLSELFSKEGFIIVSGLAKGCDTSAHRGCLSVKGKTIAVLAHGLDTIYPAENKGLALEIVQNGGTLISEYPIGQKPFGSFFIERDRLQSGLTEATIVVETDIKGGTMHTVKYTEEENKILACLDHPIQYLNTKANGNQLLIKEHSAIKIGDSTDITNLINKIYERLKIGNIEIEWKLHTLFDLNEIPETIVEKVKVPRKKSERKEIDGKKKQIVIWE